MVSPRVFVFASAVVAIGCSKAEETFPNAGATPKDAQPLAWIPGAAIAANGPVPMMTAAGICGSDKATFLTELLNGGSPADAKVKQEWSDIVKGGKQMRVSGAVDTAHLGPQDLPMSHELGDDLSMDLTLDSEFVPYGRSLGDQPGEAPDGMIHVEVSSGYLPHSIRPKSPDTGQTWAEMSAKNLSSINPNFGEPRKGDRILAQGRYIIDCGHPDYSTELHALSFVAWAESDGQSTTVRAYYNPYRDTERFNPDLSLVGKVSDTTRFSNPDTKPFPDYFQAEILRVVAGKAPRLRSYGLIDEQRESPLDWVVCAPGGTSGKELMVAYDLVARPGVTIAATPNTANGCVTMHTSIDAAYQPMDVPVRRCALPWDFLDKIAGQAVGDPNLNLPKVIEGVVGAQYKDAIEKDPEIACMDGRAGPEVASMPTAKSVRFDDTQPFPFYGVIKVGWQH